MLFWHWTKKSLFIFVLFISILFDFCHLHFSISKLLKDPFKGPWSLNSSFLLRFARLNSKEGWSLCNANAGKTTIWKLWMTELEITLVTATTTSTLSSNSSGTESTCYVCIYVASLVRSQPEIFSPSPSLFSRLFLPAFGLHTMKIDRTIVWEKMTLNPFLFHVNFPFKIPSKALRLNSKISQHNFFPVSCYFCCCFKRIDRV